MLLNFQIYFVPANMRVRRKAIPLRMSKNSLEKNKSNHQKNENSKS